jgi:hypothetical protein
VNRIEPPSPPVVGDGIPNRHSGSEANKPIRRVVIHSAVMPCEPGRARQLGAMNQTSETGSWHYATDPAETIQCSWDSVVCWHAPPNEHSIGIEMADNPGPRPTGTREQLARLRDSWRWAGKNHRAMLDRTAYLTARLCLAYGLPTRYVPAARLRAGQRGWTTHAQVSAAFRQSTHWDPGFWPRRRFGRLVRKHARQIQQEARKP